jgi:hypothetical protein
MFQYGRSTYPFINLGPQFIRIDRGQEIKFSRNSPEEQGRATDPRALNQLSPFLLRKGLID